TYKSCEVSYVCFLQAFKGRISNIPTIKKFLQPGSQRKPPTDEKVVAVVKKIFDV
ncbi:GSTA2 transferase, partial [Corythaixoides concolor]|nr:GSTA2 transferase [Corythaixoides concolor]